MSPRFILILLLPCLCAAEVYKSTTDEGSPLYSDQADSEKKPLQLPALPTLPAEGKKTRPKKAPLTRPAPTPSHSPAPQTTVISIRQPTPEQSLRSNQGEVEVMLSLTPGSLTAGRAIRLLLDQVPLETVYRQERMVLHNLDRGAHVLQAELVDNRGAVLHRSAPVRFYLHRHSILFPH